MNTSKLIESCDFLSHKCIRIAETYHGSAWLFDKLMRFFDSNKACVSIALPVTLNIPNGMEAVATICRDGSLQICRKEVYECLYL